MDKAYIALEKELHAGIYKPIYLLMGEEPFFIDHIAAYIEKNLIPEEAKVFNQSIHYGKDLTIADLLPIILRYPLGTSHQLVIVREAQSLKGIEALETYASKPNETTVLVLCHKHKLLNKKTNLYKAIKANGVIYESQKVKDYKLPEWIQRYVAGHHMKIDERCSYLLSEHLGNNLSRIANEIEKLRAILGNHAVITMDSIETHIGISKQYNLFEFQDALAQKNREKAFRIAYYYSNNPKAAPFPLLVAVLSAFFLKVLLVHHLQGKPTNEICQNVGTSPFLLKNFQKASRKYPKERIQRVFEVLRKYDAASKGLNSRASEGDLLKEMTYHILQT